MPAARSASCLLCQLPEYNLQHGHYYHLSFLWMAIFNAVVGNVIPTRPRDMYLGRAIGIGAGLPDSSQGLTLNRLCGSGMEATAQAARTIRVGEADLVISGGVESMSRAPFVMAKADKAFSRNAEIYDTTIGWRFGLSCST